MTPQQKANPYEHSCQWAQLAQPNHPCLACVYEKGQRAALRTVEQRLAQVAGDSLTISLADFERKCEVTLAEEQAKANPDNHLIGLLCDAVRLSRENLRMATQQDQRLAASDSLDGLVESICSLFEQHDDKARFVEACKGVIAQRVAAAEAATRKAMIEEFVAYAIRRSPEAPPITEEGIRHLDWGDSSAKD